MKESVLLALLICKRPTSHPITHNRIWRLRNLHIRRLPIIHPPDLNHGPIRLEHTQIPHPQVARRFRQGKSVPHDILTERLAILAQKMKTHWLEQGHPGRLYARCNGEADSHFCCLRWLCLVSRGRAPPCGWGGLSADDDDWQCEWWGWELG
jgi:hypothetical protein